MNTLPFASSPLQDLSNNLRGATSSTLPASQHRHIPIRIAHTRLCRVPLGVIACAVLSLSLLSGCQSLHQSAPVAGAKLELRDEPLQALPSAYFTQGSNADSPSSYQRIREGTDANGNAFLERTTVKMGTVRDPVITVPAPPDWGKWAVAVIGALCGIGGGVLLYNGWPKVGASLAAGGAAATVLALTVSDWGWLYALAILATAGFAAWTLTSGYNSGLKQKNTSASVLPPTPSGFPAAPTAHT